MTTSLGASKAESGDGICFARFQRGGWRLEIEFEDLRASRPVDAAVPGTEQLRLVAQLRVDLAGETPGQ